MANRPIYRGTIPEIAKAYQNDPRTQLAQAQLAAGTSTAPVAQGGWGMTDGLARAAQAIVGAYSQRAADKKYAAREDAYVDTLKKAAALAGPQAPSAPSGGAMGAAATAMAPTGPVSGPPAPASAPPLPSPTPMPSMASGGPISVAGAPPPRDPGVPADPPTVMSGSPTLPDYYRNGIRPIEGGTDPRTGAFRTSPKGAVGPGQLMPSTGPEAARLAGLPWDEKRFRTDPNYNDALGAAYYDKQLKDFGDPVHAAAAYNAGGGATRRALRRAQRAGDVGNFEKYYPAGNTETPKYVANFKAAIAGLSPGAQAGIVQPSLEAVPDAPVAPVEQPTAPTPPEAVHSRRVAMAQEMLSSGNPDMVALAQSYLDKGLDENFDADKTRNAQEFETGKMGYQAGLQDFNAARDDARTGARQERQSAIDRNFRREETAGTQAFQAGQAQTQRSFDASQSAAQRAFQDHERRMTEAFTAGESQKDRDSRYGIAALRAQKQAQRSAYFTSQAGIKMQIDGGNQINANNDTITKLERFKSLNADHATGGTYGLPGMTSLYSLKDETLGEMTSIANDATLGKLGGSLGVAISDGDRKFIGDSNISVSKPKEANDNIANALIGSLRRKSDYVVAFANAQADGEQATFLRDWGEFAKAVPIVTYGRDGKQYATANPMTFDQYQSRTKIGADGKVIK